MTMASGTPHITQAGVVLECANIVVVNVAVDIINCEHHHYPHPSSPWH